MIKIKISARGGAASPNIAQFVGNQENLYENCQFFINDPQAEADVWFVMEDVGDDDTQCLVSPERVFFVTAETSWSPGHYAPETDPFNFLGQFSKIYSCHDIYKANVINTHPFLPWMINANHGSSIFAQHDRNVNTMQDILSLPKEKALSVFCSDQNSTANHRMRIRFVRELKSYFGNNIDWFGNGFNSVDEKWDGIAPYRYTLVLENQSVPNLFTEKIYDAFLGLAYPIYWGASNLSEYFDPDSFQAINIRDINGSKEIISRLIDSDVSENRQSHLLKSRDIVLNDLNMFARFARIADESLGDVSISNNKQLVTLKPIAHPRVSKFRGGARGVAGRSLLRLGNAVNSKG